MGAGQTKSTDPKIQAKVTRQRGASSIFEVSVSLNCLVHLPVYALWLPHASHHCIDQWRVVVVVVVAAGVVVVVVVAVAVAVAVAVVVVVVVVDVDVDCCGCCRRFVVQMRVSQPTIFGSRCFNKLFRFVSDFRSFFLGFMLDGRSALRREWRINCCF